MRKEAESVNAWCRFSITVTMALVMMFLGTIVAHAQGDVDLVLGALGLIDQELSVPSLGGPTGVVSLPNAITMPADGWQAALSYQGMRASASGMYQAPDDLGVWSLQAVHKMNDTSELWASYSSATDHADSHTWALGGKKMFTRFEGGGPFVAVGASYHKWGDAFADGSWEDGAGRPDAGVTKAYAVVTGVLADEGWASGLVGSGGLMHIGLDPDRGCSHSLTRPFVTLQDILWGTELSLEYRWRDAPLDAKPVFSAAIRQVLSDKLTVELGTTNASPVGTGLPAQRLFLRLSHAL
jgi:hypothetical protein